MSELVPRTVEDTAGLLLEDLLIGPDFVRILLRRSKTDQLGRGRWVTVDRIDNPLICAVSLLSRFLSIRNSSSGHLFLHLSSLPLTVFQFNSVLKKCLHFLQLGHLRISSHSFRIGAATEAAELGLSSDEIKNLGGWKSDCYLCYVRPNVSF